MAKEKIYKPLVIDDQPFPIQDEALDHGVTQKTANDTYSSPKIKGNKFPTRRIAYEVIGSALNTKSKKILAEFEFTQSGALQIGKYVNGVSGDLKISPNGIVARNKAGLTTFAIDGATGNAVFKGELQAGSIISGLIVVGNNRVIIDGENERIVINDGTNDRVILGKF